MHRTPPRPIPTRVGAVGRALAIASACLVGVPAGVFAQAAGAAPPPATVAGSQASTSAHDDDESRITDEYVPLALEGFPSRPKPLLELGTPFLGTGPIEGFSVPGGAVWTPSFLLFGTMRSGVSSSTNFNASGGEVTTTQWANRFDLFGNLSLTFTERFVFGLRPIDRTDVTGARRFSGYLQTKSPAGTTEGFVDHTNLDWGTVSHLFFEGDLGEILPGLDRSDSRGLDYGLAIGRQPINFQEGTLINDTLDIIGVTRNNLTVGPLVSVRIAGIFAWNQINRNSPSGAALQRNREGDKSKLAGLFTEWDGRSMTVSVDTAYVHGGDFVEAPTASNPFESRVRAGDGIYTGVSFVGRPGGGDKNLAVRFLFSNPVGDPSEAALLNLSDPAARGSLIMAEYSWSPHHSYNYFYTNGFVAIEDYRAAALDPLVPGPLARVGVMFEGSGLGDGAPLSPTASRAAGAAFGHQRFSSNKRRQLLLEAAGRYATLTCPGPTSNCDPHQFGGILRFQQAAGRRWVFVLEGSFTGDSLRGRAADTAGKNWRTRRGLRFELVTQL